MSIAQKLDAIKHIIPHYWPIGSFIHHNPLKGFEDLHFKDALDKAQSIFGGNVYMDSSYFMDLYADGKINDAILEKNIKRLLAEKRFNISLEFAKHYLMEVSPQWKRLRIKYLYKNENIDPQLYAHLEKNSIYHDYNAWISRLTQHMTLYEINYALFCTCEKENVEKKIIEFISRFLDEDQTTVNMPNRELGMFETFKHYANFSYPNNAESFVEEAMVKLGIEDIEAYLLTHLLKLHGWAGFIKYRSEDENYASQQQYPSSLIDYLAIRLYHEIQALKDSKINNFKVFNTYAQDHSSDVVLQLLKHKNMLFGPALDAMEANECTDKVLSSYITNELNLDALQIQHSAELLQCDLSLTELVPVIEKLKKDEGYIWLKSLEDTYIQDYVNKFTHVVPNKEVKPIATATFCLDVRSEVIRRSIEHIGSYKTYGAGGFLGIPIAFVEFDQAHELFLAPAIVKPVNVLFEIPKECSEDYHSKKGITKTTKKVLNDLKNNPYTPFITVEAIGWIFGINLFGKTFWPQKTNKLFSKFKAEKPKTTYTMNKLSADEIEFYIHKLHTQIITKFFDSSLIQGFTEEQITQIWRHLIFDDPLTFDISNDRLVQLRQEYKITREDYNYQKDKLAMVGFTLEEQTTYLYNYLTMIGQINEFPEFITIIGHGSISDNNPFESALDCGACGGNISLPNTRALCMIANSDAVREKIKEKGIEIPNTTKFIPGLHITTTDEIKFYDLDILNDNEMTRFEMIKHDFNEAAKRSREERMKTLPTAHNETDMMIKSMDWSEPRPEWGLARNLGVFTGPRNSTKHLALDNRFFMHSYDWNIDNENADILTRIFNGPLVVGEWINLEHYFSTVDNHVYGAGSKVYHNIVSKVGVFNGNYSDLKIGLPSQSVYLEGEAYHEPIRLLSFIEAPLEKVQKAVSNSLAKPFIINEWIRPVIIDKIAQKVYAYEYGEFIVIKELAA